jgi:hypothetical protein
MLDSTRLLIRLKSCQSKGKCLQKMDHLFDLAECTFSVAVVGASQVKTMISLAVVAATAKHSHSLREKNLYFSKMASLNERSWPFSLIATAKKVCFKDLSGNSTYERI